MSSKDRRPYLTATTLNQALLDAAHDNLDCRLEVICEIDLGTEVIRVSDRNKYVLWVEGSEVRGRFYEARTNIPVIQRTVGDWLVPEIQFSTVTLELSNVDGRYNPYLPGGAQYAPWINRPLTVKIGLGENGLTYFPIFSGTITDVGGMKRSVKSVTLVARDRFDAINVSFPKGVLSKSVFPNLGEDMVGKLAPVIYGDWTTNLGPDPAAIPALVVNGADPDVLDGARNPVDLIVTTLPLTALDLENVYFKKGDEYLLVPSWEITAVGSDHNRFTVAQNATAWIPGGEAPEAYKYSQGDSFFVRCKGKDLGPYSENIIWQARDILKTYGGLTDDAFHANWETYRDKASPAASAIATFKSRIYETEQKTAIQYALSLLEQVRLEAFVSREQKVKIHSLHFEDWQANPSFTLKNWDIVKDSFELSVPEKDTFNRARGTFNFLPTRNENAQQTAVLVNPASVTQLGKAISKQITFPNLYDQATVTLQVREILKISSSLLEIGTFSVTWRSALRDIGDIIFLTISIGSTVFDTVPVMIREIGYDPVGLKIPLKAWILALCPFPNYAPGFAGTVGGYQAAITEET